MPKKVLIKENNIESPEETREEIIEQVEQAEALPPVEPPRRGQQRHAAAIPRTGQPVRSVRRLAQHWTAPGGS